MNKLKLLAVFVTIIALTVVSGAAMKPAATEYAVFGEVPDGTMDIEGEGVVGTNVWTYSPDPIELYLSENVAEVAGFYEGFARCLKKNSARLDFFFNCTGSELNTCDYRLVVLDGIYERKSDVIVFDPGIVLLDYNGGSEPVLVKEGIASFSIEFSEIGNGGEEPTGPEKGPVLCCDGEDNDGDGLIDEEDPNCKKVVCE